MWKTDLQVQDFAPEDISISLAELEGMRVWMENDNKALQQLANET